MERFRTKSFWKYNYYIKGNKHRTFSTVFALNYFINGILNAKHQIGSKTILRPHRWSIALLFHV